MVGPLLGHPWDWEGAFAWKEEARHPAKVWGLGFRFAMATRWHGRSARKCQGEVGSAEKRRGDRTGGRGGEEKSPHCSDHRDPPTLLIQSRDGAKPPEPQEDPPPTQNTLTLEIQGWMSPMGAMDWVFLPLGAPRLLLERVWSDQAVQSCPSRMRQRWWIQARDVGLAFPRMLSTLSPLLDRVTGVGPRGPRNAGDKAEAGTGTWAGPVGHSSRAQVPEGTARGHPRNLEGHGAAATRPKAPGG
ncbi:uncharacterized protein LOC126642890 isoform X2 [Myiozetetes cayanensis]|uniref:uncharacterized protein LOC126642890 isoform X2 n=1 Tax=Myiozetetes cayanensis TaxID=478635 RepID=UPI0021607229|nr:uncharacterized protein LOC126642890 isoform X2 [Myiozetetes cayanensis]